MILDELPHILTAVFYGQVPGCDSSYGGICSYAYVWSFLEDSCKITTMDGTYLKDLDVEFEEINPSHHGAVRFRLVSSTC